MSLMHLTCPWCGTSYSFGMVGRQPVGSGHACRAWVECQQEGCNHRAILQTVSELGPEDPEDQRLVCPDHVGDSAILSAQPGVH